MIKVLMPWMFSIKRLCTIKCVKLKASWITRRDFLKVII